MVSDGHTVGCRYRRQDLSPGGKCPEFPRNTCHSVPGASPAQGKGGLGVVFFMTKSFLLFTHSFIPSFIHSSTPNQHNSGQALFQAQEMEKQTKAERACVAVAPSC